MMQVHTVCVSVHAQCMVVCVSMHACVNNEHQFNSLHMTNSQSALFWQTNLLYGAKTEDNSLQEDLTTGGNLVRRYRQQDQWCVWSLTWPIAGKVLNF